MMNQYIEELAKLYGIEINDVEPGKGGLFYRTDGGEKIELSDVFDVEGYGTLVCDNVSLQKCNTYSSYSEIAALMSSAT